MIGDLKVPDSSMVAGGIEYVKVQMFKPVATRAEILDEAKNVVCKDRDSQYGPPEDLFLKIANLWSTYLGREMYAHDVSALLILLKVARAQQNPAKVDSWVDIAGYAACGAESVRVA